MKILILAALGAGLAVAAEDYVKPQPEVVRTEHLDFAPGGTIRLNGSYGDVFVEGWDEPQVEMTVKKSIPYGAAHPERTADHMESVRVATERKSAAELTITTGFPPRLGFIWRPTPPTNPRPVSMEYHLHVPRDSRLFIHHGTGEVLVRDVAGDIDATCLAGDITLWLSGKKTYSIDARSRAGTILSEFAGSTHAHYLLGQTFLSANPAPARKLHLRVGFGGIQLEPILPESEAPIPPAMAK